MYYYKEEESVNMVQRLKTIKGRIKKKRHLSYRMWIKQYQYDSDIKRAKNAVWDTFIIKSMLLGEAPIVS